MVGAFMRSLSFPNKKPPPPPPPHQIAHHFRSISLPSRPHPLIPHLRRHIHDLHLWSTNPSTTAKTTSSSSWLCEGLAKLKDVHDYLDDIIQLPQTRDSLCRHPGWIENLLEDFLRFADVYGTFQNLVFGMKEVQMSVQVAVRKRDELKVASLIKGRKKLGKEMAKLVQVVQQTKKSGGGGTGSLSFLAPEGAELAGILREIMEVTVLVSTIVFNGFSTKTTSWMGGLMRKRTSTTTRAKAMMDEGEVGRGEWFLGLKRKSEEEVRVVLRQMVKMEGCICEIESGGERVFRSLISTRVSLLNCLAHH